MKILSISYHAYSDPSSGAALSLRELMGALTKHGWEGSALCGPVFDSGSHFPTARKERQPGHDLLFYQDTIPVTCYVPDGPVRIPIPEYQEKEFIRYAEYFLGKKPNVLLLYGGGSIHRKIITLAQERNIPTVFWLRNAEYHIASLFDKVIPLVPSQALRSFYKKTLNINSTVVPSLVNWDNVSTKSGDALSFITPTQAKGALWAARIFEQLQDDDIPFLVAEGRGSFEVLEDFGLKRNRFSVVPNTADMKSVYAQTKMTLAPSLWYEGFLRVGVESMINGIPTIGSSRGSIPETLLNTGIVLDIPSKFTPTHPIIPKAKDVLPWVNAIRQVWKNAQLYTTLQQRANTTKNYYNYDKIASQHIEFFKRIIH